MNTRLVLVPIVVAMAPALVSPTSFAMDCGPISGQISLARCQIALEQRRAGGPRRAALVAGLERLARLDPRIFIVEADGACLRRFVPCREVVRLAPGGQSVKGEYRNGYLGHLEVVRKEAALEDLGPEARKALFLRLLSAGSGAREVVGNVGELTRASAARHALEERDPELVAEVEARASQEPVLALEIGRSSLRVAACILAPSEAACLMQIIEEGVEPSRGRRDGSGSDLEEDKYSADLACQRLRQIGDSSVIPELKELMARVSLSTSDAGSSPQRSAVGAKAMSVVRQLIARLVGDLGDRDFERQSLGGSCLWDRVHNAETAMVRKGLLAASATVTLNSK